MDRSTWKAALLAGALLWLPGLASAQASYDGFRWFQVELSLFSNDYPEYRDAQLWTPDRLDLAYPPRTREFLSVARFLMVSEFATDAASEAFNPIPGAAAEDTQGEETLPLPEVGPFPRRTGPILRMLDFARDPYLLLPPSESDFQTTNTRLERSAVNRLLFTGVWRQPVMESARAQALIVRGGRQVGQRHELEGTVTIRFNQNEDRVVIDANLWLMEFAPPGLGDPAWQLPPLPQGSVADEMAGAADNPDVTRIVQLRQSRDMRSNEFHYLDHPALGLVVNVKPYELPPPVAAGSAGEPAVLNGADPAAATPPPPQVPL